MVGWPGWRHVNAMIDWTTRILRGWVAASPADRPKDPNLHFSRHECILLVIGSGGVLVKKPLFGARSDPAVTALLPMWMDGAEAYRLCGLDNDFVSDDAVQVRSNLLAGLQIGNE